MRLIRFLFKIPMLPIALALSLFLAMFAFLRALSEWPFTLAATVIGTGGIIMVITGDLSGGIGCFVIGFLLSPLGLLALVDLLFEGLASLNGALYGFIMS